VRDAGVVDEEVDRPELALDLADHPLDVLHFGDVGDDSQPADLLGNLLNLLGRPGRDCDLHPGVGELAGDSRTDPAPPTRDECDLPVHPIGHGKSLPRDG
jgi:hypothetical protein